MALYLGKDKIAGHSIDSKIGDTLPVGAIIDYDGTEVPANWELVEDNGTDASAANAIVLYNYDTEAEKVSKFVNAFGPRIQGTAGYSLIAPLFYEHSLNGKHHYIPVTSIQYIPEMNLLAAYFVSTLINDKYFNILLAVDISTENPTTFHTSNIEEVEAETGDVVIPNATATTVGGIKVRLDGNVLYITTDGSDA